MKVTLTVMVEEEEIKDFIRTGKIPCNKLSKMDQRTYSNSKFWLAYMVKKAYVEQILKEEW
jgi:hypothetical protein